MGKRNADEARAGSPVVPNKRIRGSTAQTESQEAEESAGESPTLETPTKKRTPAKSTPGKKRKATKAAVGPTASSNPVEAYVPAELRQFMKTAKTIDDWKGRCYVLWATIFFVRRGFTADELHQLLGKVMPLFLRPDIDELAGFFERVYEEFMDFFCQHTRTYGDEYLSCAAGVEWRKAYLLAKKGKRKKPAPDITGEGGIEFGHVQLIGFFRTSLFAVRTKPAPALHVGWIAEDEDGYWFDTLRDILLEVISCFVVGEAVLPGSHSNEAISRDLAAHPNPCPGGHLRWPPFTRRLDDYSSWARVESRPSPPSAYDEGSHLNFVGDEYPPAIADLKQSLPNVTEEARKTFEPSPEQAKEFYEHGQQYEGSITESFLQKRAEDLAAGDALADRPVFHPEIECSVQQPSKHFEPPTWYATELSNLYARSNIWAKSQIHIRLLDEERHRLDALNYDIKMRISAIEAEIEETTKKAEAIDMRINVLQSLYGDYANVNASLDAARVKLRGAESRQKGVIPGVRRASAAPRNQAAQQASHSSPGPARAPSRSSSRASNTMGGASLTAIDNEEDTLLGGVDGTISPIRHEDLLINVAAAALSSAPPPPFSPRSDTQSSQPPLSSFPTIDSEFEHEEH